MQSKLCNVSDCSALIGNDQKVKFNLLTSRCIYGLAWHHVFRTDSSLCSFEIPCFDNSILVKCIFSAFHSKKFVKNLFYTSAVKLTDVLYLSNCQLAPGQNNNRQPLSYSKLCSSANNSSSPFETHLSSHIFIVGTFVGGRNCEEIPLLLLISGMRIASDLYGGRIDDTIWRKDITKISCERISREKLSQHSSTLKKMMNDGSSPSPLKFWSE